MCVKIIGEVEQEFDPKQPLEQQIVNAREIVVNYDPVDSKLPFLVNQMEVMVKKGVSFKPQIKFNANNNLNGIRLERQIDRLKKAFEANEFIKQLAISYSVTDKKLSEISEMFKGIAK